MTEEKRQIQYQLPMNSPEYFERELVPLIFRPWAQSLIERTGLRQGDRVLDIGCGTGIVARLAAHEVGSSGRVTGVDSVPGMLAVAQSVPLADGVKIEWHQADATALPFPDACFDVVLLQQVLQFVSDRHAAVREIHRVLAVGGRLGLSVWRSREHNPGTEALVQALARHVGEKSAAVAVFPYLLGSEDELRMLLEEAGFRDVSIHSMSKPVRYATPEVFADQRLGTSGLDDVTRAALRSDISTALRYYVDTEGLALPTAANIAVARR